MGTGHLNDHEALLTALQQAHSQLTAEAQGQRGSGTPLDRLLIRLLTTVPSELPFFPLKHAIADALDPRGPTPECLQRVLDRLAETVEALRAGAGVSA